jgi:hypothetical protein
VNASRRNWRLVAGVVVMLVALIVVGRLQGQNLGTGDTEPSRAASTTVADTTPVISGLAVAGRVALPVPAAAMAVGEGAVWVLLEEGTLLRVDPDRHQVTGRLELGAPSGGMPMGPWDVRVGPLAVGAGAVWVGTRRGTVTVRVDPVRLRVTARLGGNAVAVAVAHGVLWSYCCRRADKVMGFGRIDARTLQARRPLVVTDAAGKRQPVGALAVGTDTVWSLPLEGGRLWRVPLGGGPARALPVAGFPHGLAVDGGAVWVLSGTGEPGSGLDRTGRLRRLDQRTGAVTATTPLPDVDLGRVNVAVGHGDGGVWVAGPYARRSQGGGILLRVDPASGRVAGWLRDPRWSFQGVLADGPRGAWAATAAPVLLHVVAA